MGRRSVGFGSWTRRPAPCSGRRFSPLGFWTQVDPRATQATLRSAFQRWGLPERLRVDNGAPRGSRGDLPTDLVCWLAGLGVAVSANAPRCPQANGVVERGQGVGKQWCEPWTCESAGELQRRLEEMDRVQREVYPTRSGRSRLAAEPGLEHSGRVYDPAEDDSVWDLQEVWELVGSHRVPRQVDRGGKLSVDNRPYSVGPAWAGRTVWVGFDAVQGHWTIQDERGYEIRRHPASELSRESVCGMEVTHRRNGAHAAKPSVRIKPAKPTVR
jgi:hypothetical protein